MILHQQSATEWNSIDPIKYRFPVQCERSFFGQLFLVAACITVVVCRCRLYCCRRRRHSHHHCWLGAVDWVATPTPDHIIILLFDWNLMVDFKEGPSSWIESIEVQKRPHRTQFIPFFRAHFFLPLLLFSFISRLSEKLCTCAWMCVIYDYFQCYWSWTNIESKNCQ